MILFTRSLRCKFENTLELSGVTVKRLGEGPLFPYQVICVKEKSTFSFVRQALTHRCPRYMTNETCLGEYFKNKPTNDIYISHTIKFT